MMMTCHEVRDSLTDYLAGDLSPQERGEIEHHLEGCRHCAGSVDATRNVLRVSRAALARVDEPSAADVPASLVQAIKAHQQSPAGVPVPEMHLAGMHLMQLHVQFSEVPIRL
jgi:anti-sigma factor RsiW